VNSRLTNVKKIGCLIENLVSLILMIMTPKRVTEFSETECAILRINV
jgi:hypothetical protein